MPKKRDGGPAFPVPVPEAWGGMSLRDYFAGQVIIGNFASQTENWCVENYKAAAAGAYEMADALIAERNK